MFCAEWTAVNHSHDAHDNRLETGCNGTSGDLKNDERKVKKNNLNLPSNH